MIVRTVTLAGEEFAGDLDAVVARPGAAFLARCASCLLTTTCGGEALPSLSKAWPAHSVLPQAALPSRGRLRGRVDGPSKRCGSLVSEHRPVRSEIGLDYHYDFSPRPWQDVFRAQMGWRSSWVPIIIHTRRPPRTHIRDSATPAVAVCEGSFTASRRRGGDGAFRVGYRLLPSFAGIVTFPGRIHSRRRENRARRPVFAETDAPYLAPVPHRGKRNEPAFVAEVAARLAAIQKRSRSPICPPSCTTISMRCLEVWRKLQSRNGLAR